MCIIIFVINLKAVLILLLTDKLDILMQEKSINKSELSRDSGIPYMTIVNFYEKGSDNVKLSTLKKLANYFNCSLDFIADDDVTDRNYGLDTIKKQPQENLTADEKELIKCYKSCSEEIKEALLVLARNNALKNTIAADESKFA